MGTGRPVEHHVDLPYRPPFAWGVMLAYFAARALPGVEAVHGGTYRRTAQVDGLPVAVELAHRRPGALHLRVLAGRELEDADLEELGRRAARLFSLATDAEGADEHLAGDPRLAGGVAACPGLRPPGAWDPYETGVRAIVGQQVSVAGATTVAGRIVARGGARFAVPGLADPALQVLFPPPELLARTDLGSIGMPTARAAAVQRWAGAVASGDLVLDGSPFDSFVAGVAALRGLGPWTAQYLALRSGYADAFPAADLGVRRALAGVAGDLPTARAVLEQAQAWRPWRAHATVHLWLGGGASARERLPGPDGGVDRLDPRHERPRRGAVEH